MSFVLSSIPKVGPKWQEKLCKLGITTPVDLLFHLPRQYQDKTRIVSVTSVRIGQMAQVQGRIIKAQIVFAKRRTLLCHIDDDGHLMVLRFFYFNQQQYKAMVPGRMMRCFGEVRYSHAHKEMVHPEYRIFDAEIGLPLADRLTPIYPLTDGVTQLKLRSLINFVLPKASELVEELLPKRVLQDNHLPDICHALNFVHHPPLNADVAKLLEGRHAMQQRLVFEELLAHRLGLRKIKATRADYRAHPAEVAPKMVEEFLSNLSFQLTQAQRRSYQQMAEDLSQAQPMLRLLQGDVGSGKTLVAVLCLLQVIAAGHQGALMVPTEVLAEQHYMNIKSYLEPLGIQVCYLVSSIGAKAKSQAMAQLASGEISVVVGTQALFQHKIEFKRLALVIVDEQHRFGVEQRRQLLDKGANQGFVPHQLLMTATPIPRTLAMTAYADLEVSVLDELPKGRQGISTRVLPQLKRQEVMSRLLAYLQKGCQAYWVCTLIEESEALNCQSALACFEMLQRELPSIKVELVHGQMKVDQKTQVMADFKAGRIDLLVATTVIEVGVDVANASVMVIENPERLGLAQLHQLRGRVGRGNQQGFCLMLYDTPLSNTARARLDVMRSTQDGFVIADKDLEIRGPGEVLGTKQTGAMTFKVADLLRDQGLLPQVTQVADALMAQDASLVDRLIRRWLNHRQGYGQV